MIYLDKDSNKLHVTLGQGDICIGSGHRGGIPFISFRPCSKMGIGAKPRKEDLFDGFEIKISTDNMESLNVLLKAVERSKEILERKDGELAEPG